MAGRHGWLVSAWVVIASCGDDAPADTNGGSSSSGESTSDGSTSIDPDSSSTAPSADTSTDAASESTGAGETTTSEGSTTNDDTTTSGESTSTGGESTSTGVETTESTSGGSDPSASESSTGEACVGQPDDSMCSEACECSSNECYLTGFLGGFCGECDEDADCPNGGCTQPEPLLSPPLGSVCNDGSLGGGCQTDAACQAPLLCAVVLDIPGIVTSQTCSECELDADCGTDLCAPTYALPSIDGFFHCVAPASQPNGSACSLDGSGDQSCASGHCATADLMGFLTLGVCSECEDDTQCTMVGETCFPAEVMPDGGLQAAFCG